MHLEITTILIMVSMSFLLGMFINTVLSPATETETEKHFRLAAEKYEQRYLELYDRIMAEREMFRDVVIKKNDLAKAIENRKVETPKPADSDKNKNKPI